MSDPPFPVPPPAQNQAWLQGQDEAWWSAAIEAQRHRTMTGALLDALTSAALELLGRARQLMTGTDSDRQLAVIFAMSACELQTEKGLSDLLNHRARPLTEPVIELMGVSISLGNDRVKKVYGALTGDYPAGSKKPRIAKASWWDDWDSSRNFRNEVAHRGKAVSPQDAEKCVKAANAYIAHMAVSVNATLTKLTP